MQWGPWTDNAAQLADVPWLRADTGKAVAQCFFEQVAQFKFEDLQVLSMMAGGTQVSVEVRIDAIMLWGILRPRRAARSVSPDVGRPDVALKQAACKAPRAI